MFLCVGTSRASGSGGGGVHQPEIHQQVIDMLAIQVMGFAGVGDEVPYHYEILVREECQELLQVQ